MAQGTPKRKIEDSVFTNLFQDKKYLLWLYQALRSEDNGVVDIMMTLFDDEEIMETYLEAYAKDIEDNTTQREARKTAERMIKMGKLSLEEIALCVPTLSINELKKLETKIIQTT